MTKDQTNAQMTRAEMQTEAMHIQGLLSVAMGYTAPAESVKVYQLLDMAHEHASRLNEALDSMNAAKGGDA